MSNRRNNKSKGRAPTRATAKAATVAESLAANRLDSIREAAALNELHAKSPRSAKGFQDAQCIYLEKLERLKCEIRSMKGLHLDRLEKAGADPEMILHVLAMEIHGSPWRRPLRSLKQSQKQLASRLREDADRLEQMYGSDASFPDLYAIIPPGARGGPVVPASERVPRLLLREIRACADELDGFAREFGRYLQNRSPKLERQFVAGLLNYVHCTTGNVHRHLVVLAALLTDIYEKYKIRKRVSPESLAKIFERHVKPQLQFTDKAPS